MKGILDYAHAELWGPARQPTHSANIYFLYIIDDYSMKVWNHFLKNKSDAFDKFKTWKLLIENPTNRKLKVLRTDNGLEFCNEFFIDFVERMRLRDRTIANTPQQNGVT